MLVSIRGMDPEGVYGPKPDRSMKMLEEGRKWHPATPLEYFTNIRKRFDAAGVAINGYNCGWFGTPQEIDRSFEQAKALGARCITLSGTASLARKLAPYADRQRFIVAMHPHSQINDPDPVRHTGELSLTARDVEVYLDQPRHAHFHRGRL